MGFYGEYLFARLVAPSKGMAFRAIFRYEPMASYSGEWHTHSFGGPDRYEWIRSQWKKWTLDGRKIWLYSSGKVCLSNGDDYFTFFRHDKIVDIDPVVARHIISIVEQEFTLRLL